MDTGLELENISLFHEEDEFKPRFNIRTVSAQTGISPNLIRAYERMGMIKPYREGNNYRLFTLHEIRWILRIKRLFTEVGLNVEGIKCLLTIEPCWQVHQCPEEVYLHCLAYHSYNTPCWQLKENADCCDKNHNSCYNCSYYIKAIAHPKLHIKENNRVLVNNPC